MYIHQHTDRRNFLRHMSQLSLAGVAAPFATNLAAFGEASAQSASDYKALVCIFLYGGNDNGNTLIPVTPSSFSDYLRVRGNLALAHSALTNTTLPLQAGYPQYALHPELAPLVPLFAAKRLRVQLIVGPLIQPTTVTQYNARSVPLPPTLFSHNDRQSVWQSSNAKGPARVGAAPWVIWP